MNSAILPAADYEWIQHGSLPCVPHMFTAVASCSWEEIRSNKSQPYVLFGPRQPKCEHCGKPGWGSMCLSPSCPWPEPQVNHAQICCFTPTEAGPPSCNLLHILFEAVPATAAHIKTRVCLTAGCFALQRSCAPHLSAQPNPPGSLPDSPGSLPESAISGAKVQFQRT